MNLLIKISSCVKIKKGEIMGNIYIFGHRNPDTDSVCSSIALSYLKNSLGKKTEPRILSVINNETKFALNYFKMETPKYLNDVKVRIKNVKYEKKVYINEFASINEAFKMMQLKNTTAVPIVDNDRKLKGYVTLKEIAKYLISDKKNLIETTLNNILNTLDGEVLTQYIDKVKGSTKVAGVQSNTFLDEVEISPDDIIIVGNRHKVLDYIIKKGVKLIILSYGSKINNKLLSNAEKNKVTIIRTKMDSFNVANKISLSNFIKLININLKPITVMDEDYYTDFKQKIHKINHTNYPVINKKGECLGLLRLTGPNNYNIQKVILVDHNSFAQSVEGIEEADILEIIDHHNLGAIGTNIPINFRSLPVGCTATIIYDMYKENNIEIPQNIAGLLLSAIISDTLLFNSPTTTEDDKFVAIKLAKIAKVDLDKYSHDLLKAASSIEGMSIKELVYIDYKSYTVNNKNLGISVITTMDFDEIKQKISEIREFLNNKADEGQDLCVMFVTDAIKNGSYIIYNDRGENIIKSSFGLDTIYQGIFIKKLVSRKKQMLPAILDTIEVGY